MNRIVFLILLIMVSSILWANGGAESNRNETNSAEQINTSAGNKLQLIDLINRGDERAVDDALKLELDLDYKDEEGLTALHAASRTGNTQLVGKMLMRGVSIDPVDNRGKTPLHYAVENQHGRVIAMLVEAGADISIEDENGLSPAILALERQSEIISDLLTEKSVNTRFREGNTLLHFASKKGLISHVEALIQLNAGLTLRNFSGQTPLDYSLAGNLTSDIAACSAKLLRNGSPEPGDDNWKYITEPLRNGNYEIRFESGVSAQHLATEKKHDSMLRFFLSEGANVDSRDKHGNTPLHLAIHKGYKTISSLIDIRDAQGNTPLLLAIESSNRGCSELFLSRDAEIFSNNNQGLSPVQAALRQNEDVISWFFAENRVTHIDNEGKSPLHYAVMNAVPLENLQTLLDLGADIFAMDSSGRTPVEFLIEKGATESIRNARGETPHSLAVKTGNKDLSDLLL